jgi:hypothetical protein
MHRRITKYVKNTGAIVSGKRKMMMSGYQGVAAMAQIMTSPDISKVIESLQAVGHELSDWRLKMSSLDQESGFNNHP